MGNLRTLQLWLVTSILVSDFTSFTLKCLFVTVYCILSCSSQTFTLTHTHTHTHTHTQPFYGPLSRTTQVGRYQKRHSPTHTWNELWESVIILDFMRRGEDNRVKCAHNPAVRHPIQTIDATTSIVPAATFPIYHGLGQAPNVLDCIPGGLVTWRLYSLLLFHM